MPLANVTVVRSYQIALDIKEHDRLMLILNRVASGEHRASEAKALLPLFQMRRWPQSLTCHKTISEAEWKWLDNVLDHWYTTGGAKFSSEGKAEGGEVDWVDESLVRMMMFGGK